MGKVLYRRAQRRIEYGLEVEQSMHADRGPLHVLRSSMATIHMTAKFLLLAPVCVDNRQSDDADSRSKKTMDNDVSVPANRRGEVRVHWSCKTVVMPLVLRHLTRAEVLRGHHTTSGQNAKKLVKVWVALADRKVKAIRQRLKNH